MAETTKTRAESLWQFWIDVGGTFTDCIAVDSAGRCRQFKVLSSGVIRGQCAINSTATAIVDPARIADPADFWVGAAVLLRNSEGTSVARAAVESFDAVAGKLQLKDLQPAASSHSLPTLAGLAYEIDLGVPAPVLAIRWLMRMPAGVPCPAVQVRLGTTRGTNALLTRTGARTLLLTTRGFADVPLIGNQSRPELFAIDIVKPRPLFHEVVEVDERIAADGSILIPLSEDSDERHTVDRLRQWRSRGIDSVAICLMNAYRNDTHERLLEQWARQAGFTEVSRSSEVSPLIRFVPRCETTTLDAYLNPVLRQYLADIIVHLPGSPVQVMTSTAGLVVADHFRGRDCLLSGPAGGIVGFSRVAKQEGFRRAIGFDMGGTSTDVARFDGQLEYENETIKAGVRIMTPMLAIETVAAGGGSICRFDGVRLSVGPESAAAVPGPACYGAGGPLTVTDLNVFLGRVIPEHFPFPLNTLAVAGCLTELRSSMCTAGVVAADMSLAELAEGLLRIANDKMVQAIRRISVAKGYLPADYVLVGFGGAAGQHVCSVARSLGIRQVLLHPWAGLLSAYGMGLADVRVVREQSVLQNLNEESVRSLESTFRQMTNAAIDEIAAQHGELRTEPRTSYVLLLRYAGTEAALPIAADTVHSVVRQFEHDHQRLFGYVRSGKLIEISAVRVEVVVASPQPAEMMLASAAIQDRVTAIPESRRKVWFGGVECEADLVLRHSLRGGDVLTGPLILCEPTSTVFVEPGCTARICGSGAVLISVNPSDPGPELPQSDAGNAVDPILLEVFSNQFTSIAEQMGETLRRTAISTNVRERLDFSCALFDGAGRLVVNAPHVPVHLGAMGETVLAVIDAHPEMQPGDVYVTNDPFRGGSHLPDITVVTPVFAQTSADRNKTYATVPLYYVANRAHHAEIGGIQPGSMPPFSRNLSEEGILIRTRKLVDCGQSCEDELRELLLSGPYPSRAVADNLADLAAQVAANACGVRRLQQLSAEHQTDVVSGYMRHIQVVAARKMKQCLAALENRELFFCDQLDDGTPICVTITIQDEHATIDFSGSGRVHPGNLNANRAITTAAVLYTMRCLLAEDVPLNAGVLDPITLVIPEGILNPPEGPTAETTPAVVGGNVETSQRIVDVLFGAFGLAAASQGTMNNLTFGDQTFGYYETICGGAGASARTDGADAVHTHMTNTRLTDPEVLEHRYPVRLRQFRIRRGSGGSGVHRGGDGIVRELEFLKSLNVSMLAQRRERPPYGICGGQPGFPGKTTVRNSDNSEATDVGGSFTRMLKQGSILRIETPGGGGWGAVPG